MGYAKQKPKGLYVNTRKQFVKKKRKQYGFSKIKKTTVS